MSVDIFEIREKLKNSLEIRRYSHSISVSYVAATLAMVYGVDIDKAMLAGLMHDCAKNIPISEQIEICRNNNIYLDEYELSHTCVIHGKVGAYIAKEIYGVYDEDILNAIYNHVRGRVGMSLLEKIVFIADYIEPERKNISNLDVIRKMAYKNNNIDETIVLIYNSIIEYLKSKESVIDDFTINIVNYYRSKING